MRRWVVALALWSAGCASTAQVKTLKQHAAGMEQALGAMKVNCDRSIEWMGNLPQSCQAPPAAPAPAPAPTEAPKK